MGVFEPGEIEEKEVKISPKMCYAGQQLSIWIASYGKPAATHIWDIAVSRALANHEEIERAIADEMLGNKIGRIEAQRSLILQGGLYKLSKKAVEEQKQEEEIDAEIKESLRVLAAARGITIKELVASMFLESWEPEEE